MDFSPSLNRIDISLLLLEKVPVRAEEGHIGAEPPHPALRATFSLRERGESR